MTRLSVVIPVYNEQDNLVPLHEALTTVLGGWGGEYEILCVDDGSTDQSFQRLRELASRDPHVKAIRFRHNAGQTAALSAGIHYAKHETIILMDADRQNDPADIPRLLARLDEGYDVVSGWRKERRDPLLHRKLPSWIANRLISVATGVPLHDYGCTLKAYRRTVLEDVRLYGEMHRFIPAYAAQQGARITEMVVTHHPRVAGRSKYGLSRTFKVVLDLLLVKFLWGYATKPLHLFGSIGTLACVGGLLAAAITIYEKLAWGVYVHRNPLILLAVFLFLLGVQCVLMGFLAELIIRTYHETQHKPTYAVAEVINLAREPGR